MTDEIVVGVGVGVDSEEMLDWDIEDSDCIDDCISVSEAPPPPVVGIGSTIGVSVGTGACAATMAARAMMAAVYFIMAVVFSSETEGKQFSDAIDVN